MSLRVLSLFAGIGGMDLGLERAGMVVVGQCEVDQFACRVLAKHWPSCWRHEDVRSLTAAMVAAGCGPIDLICGGFPCQDISNAGKRAGITGERSGLWSEFHRIIRDVRPRYVLVENVAALLIRGMDRVLGDLAAVGYDAEWQCVPAAAVGAPHLRNRVFIVAYTNGRGWCARVGESGEPAGSRMQQLGEPGQRGGGISDSESGGWGERRTRGSSAMRQGQAGQGAVSHSIFEGLEGDECGELALAECWGRNADPARSGWWATEPALGRVADGVPHRVDRLRGLGNAVVPQVAEYVGRRILAFDRARQMEGVA